MRTASTCYEPPPETRAERIARTAPQRRRAAFVIAATLLAAATLFGVDSHRTQTRCVVSMECGFEGGVCQ